MIDELKVADHYRNLDLFDLIKNGLVKLGVSLDAVSITDLSRVDNFHVGGESATQFVIDHLHLDAEKSILDIGCGIGGPARFIAQSSGCMVCGIDITESYIETGIQLNTLVGLDKNVDLRHGSALALPYENSSFDGAYMIHVGMNIDDKNKLMSEAYRVLKAGSNFVLFDIMKEGDAKIDYPLPWAQSREESAVDLVQSYETGLTDAGFNILDTVDKNQFAVEFFETLIEKMMKGGQKPLGLHLLMGKSTKDKVMNAHKQFKDGRLSPVLMIAQK